MSQAKKGTARRKRGAGGKKSQITQTVNLVETTCKCGCGMSFLADVTHGQKYIEGHGGKALCMKRKAALQGMLAIALIGAGADWITAQERAALAVERNLEMAKLVMRRQGWDYENRCLIA